MFCTACGSELGPGGTCTRCARVVSAAGPDEPAGDPFLPPRIETPPNHWKAPLFTLLTILLLIPVFWLNYLRAMHWAGVINPESAGYMIGGIVTSLLLGLLGMFVLGKIRGRKLAPASKAMGISIVALFASLLVFSAELAGPRPHSKADPYHQAGNLLKQAAGKAPRTADVNWWDSPSREFFHDILEMNKSYSAEVAALDSSAIKDLYSSKSYGGEVHMQKVVTQLHAALAVDEKYASMDPMIKKLETRIASANVSENERQEFLKGLRGSLDRTLASRNELIHTEEEWMKSTIDLYEFMIAHTAGYTIRDNKLYFRDEAVRKEFTSQQSRAIALHKEFVKAKSTADSSRKSKMDQLGVSPSDLSQSQPEKSK